MVIIMMIIITPCHNVINIILKCVISVIITASTWCQRPQGAMRGVTLGAGMGWGRVRRANSVHLHFHIFHTYASYAMLMCVHTRVMLYYSAFSCTFPHTPCHATLQWILLHFQACIMLHESCYATSTYLNNGGT